MQKKNLLLLGEPALSSSASSITFSHLPSVRKVSIVFSILPVLRLRFDIFVMVIWTNPTFFHCTQLKNHIYIIDFSLHLGFFHQIFLCWQKFLLFHLRVYVCVCVIDTSFFILTISWLWRLCRNIWKTKQSART